ATLSNAPRAPARETATLHIVRREGGLDRDRDTRDGGRGGVRGDEGERRDRCDGECVLHALGTGNCDAAPRPLKSGSDLSKLCQTSTGAVDTTCGYATVELA